MSVIRHFVAAALFLPAAFATDVIRVPSDVGNIQAAVDLAQPGDVILAAPFSYLMPIVVDGKGVTLVADGGASLTTLEVRNVPAGQTFVLDGFMLDVPFQVPGAHVPFIAQDNAGALRIQDCIFKGDAGSAGNWPAGVSAYSGTSGVSLNACADVAFHACTMIGGPGADLIDENIDAAPTSGGVAIDAVSSTLIVDDCVLTGGVGGSAYDTVIYSAGWGGDGVAAHGASFVAMSGCTVTGGHGGSGDCTFFACGSGGPGGDAIRFTSSLGVATVRGNDFTSGIGGLGGDGAKAPDGVLVDSGTSTTFLSRVRRVSLPSPVREGSSALFGLDGESGDLVQIYASIAPGFTTLAQYEGTFLIGGPLVLSAVTLGVLPGGGLLDVALPVPDLGPGIDAFDVHVQSVFFDAGATPLLGPARVLTLLDDGI